MKFIVSYALSHERRVMVGIDADSAAKALKKARAAFDDGTIWDDTETMPLLLDEYEEVDDAILDFKIEQTLPDGGAYPPPDVSVLATRRDTAARRAAALLVAAYRNAETSGSVAWDDLDLAYEAALLA